MADLTLYYFDELGFASAKRVYQAGATTVAIPSDPPPLGKEYRWDGTQWYLDSTPVGSGGGGGGSGADRELLLTLYRVLNAGTGMSVGDVISATRMLDVSGSNAAQIGATSWFNETTGAVLASAPASTGIEPMGSPGLTNAQLRADPVATAGSVAGDIPSNTVDSGNPVKMGAKAATVLSIVSTVAHGDRVDLAANNRGAMYVQLTDLAGDSVVLGAASNSVQTGDVGMLTTARSMVFNPITGFWDGASGDATAMFVHGTVPPGTADTGNPMKIGGKAVDMTLTPTYRNPGERVDAWFDQYGAQAMFISDGFGTRTKFVAPSAGDNMDQSNIAGLATNARGYLLDPNTGVWSRQRGNAKGVWMQGSVASDVADDGANPIKIGGIAYTTPQVSGAANDGNRKHFITTLRGALWSAITDGNGNPVVAGVGNSDVSAAGSYGLTTNSRAMVFNGVSGNWERVRGSAAQGMLVNTAGEAYSSVTILNVQTSTAPATAFAVFANQACTSLDVVNNSAVDIEYQRGGAGNTMRIKAGAFRTVRGITNANQIGVRRVDLTASAVQVDAEAFVV